MRLILGIRSLGGLGGTESYVVTVADHLQRTGHDVYVYSAHDGPAGDVARQFGLRVLIGPSELPNDADALLTQDTISALELLKELPGVPQIYNWHSEYFDVQVPPQLDGVVKLNVVLHADALRRVRSLAVKTPLLQLTHPIDTMRFRPLNSIADRPRRLVAMSNYLGDAQELRLRAACDLAGIEFHHVGATGEEITTQPELVMNDADIVAGKARVVLEAMACGRAAYVYDQFGNDGWVTPESYPRLEPNCFAGRTSSRALSAAQIAQELLEYSPRMGDANRALVVERHSAMTHVGRLVEAIEPVVSVRGSAVTNDCASELARLARTSWYHESRAYAFSMRSHDLSVQLDEQSQRAATLELGLARAEAKLRRTRQRLNAVTTSRRWRAMQRLLAPLDALRKRL